MCLVGCEAIKMINLINTQELLKAFRHVIPFTRVYLMLELARVTSTNWNNTTIAMETQQVKESLSHPASNPAITGGH